MGAAAGGTALAIHDLIWTISTQSPCPNAAVFIPSSSAQPEPDPHQAQREETQQLRWQINSLTQQMAS
eukprot:8407025-Karenia_brevis.AAC.1